jgi:hypothetical protein
MRQPVLLSGLLRVVIELLEWAERQARAHNALEDRVARLEAAVAAARGERGQA